MHAIAAVGVVDLMLTLLELHLGFYVVTVALLHVNCCWCCMMVILMMVLMLYVAIVGVGASCLFVDVTVVLVLLLLYVGVVACFSLLLVDSHAL